MCYSLSQSPLSTLSTASLVQDTAKLPAPSGKATIQRRRKIWELETDLHCSVIGTCMPVLELRKIYRRINGNKSEPFSDYQMHNLFVRYAGETHAAIKRVQKCLETRYRAAIRQFSSFTDEQSLEQAWYDYVKNGEVAAGYWALVTHPALTDRLNVLAFGEIHMLSHLAGQTWQAECAKRRQQEQAKRETTQRLAEKENTVQQQQKQIEKLHIAAHKQLTTVVRQEETIESLQTENAQLRNNSSQQHFVAVTSKLEARINQLQRQESARVCSEIKQLQQQETNLKTRLEQLHQQNTLLENRLQALLQQAEQQNTDAQQQQDLCGKCVLYVGGKTRCQAGFRILVEKLNGKFLYHDGGREDNHHRLTSLVQQADTVICPTTCISHSAVNEIKKACARQTKTPVWLAAHSLSAFNAVIDQLAQSRSSAEPH